MEQEFDALEDIPAYDLSGVRTLIVDRYQSYTRILAEQLSDFGITSLVANVRSDAYRAICSENRIDVLALGGASDLSGGTSDFPIIAKTLHRGIMVVSMACLPEEQRDLIFAGADVATEKAYCYRSIVFGLVERRKMSGVRVAVQRRPVGDES